ncbi:MAG TPA: diguanylate cyclase [Nitrospiria bacterium]|jgi:GGDEF domain-containing protein|nr:diguanylate cyclase [Nitrospiria bacterium]
MRLTLINKMLLGFSIMVLLTLLTGLYAVVSLRDIRRMSDAVVQRDLPIIETAGQMTENLLAQDLYEKRSVILRDPAVRTLFFNRSDEFRLKLAQLNFSSPEDEDLKGRIHSLHQEYDQFFKEEQDYLDRKQESMAKAVSEGPMQSRLNEMVKLLREFERRGREDQNSKTLQANQSSLQAFNITVVLVTISFFFGVGFAVFINSSLTYSIKQLQEAAHYIGQGLFDRALNVKATEEVQELAESFRWMSKRLKELGEMNLDANPLTRLPGNLAIEKALLTRLQEKVPFAFCLVDLDNFKAFGDRYGYIRGSEVLKKVAGILTEAVKALGSVPDFLGHIGGDDYVIITDPLRMEKLCEKVIHDFDETIPGFYDEEDRQRGYIISRDRKDVEQQFPFMTVSIAVVTNQKRAITSPMQVAEIAAQLKQYAKTFPRSVYVVDQRRTA